MKVIRVLGIVLVVASLMAGCGSSAATPTSAPTVAPAQATNTPEAVPTVAATATEAVAPTVAATATEAVAPTTAATATEAVAPTAAATATEAVAATSGSTANWGVVKVPAGQPIIIGMGAGTSGDVANLGIDERRGAELAVEDHPEIRGHKVQMAFEDDLCSGEGGTAVAQKMVANPQVVAFIGDMCGSGGVPASTIYEQAGIPMVSPSITAVAFTARGLRVTNTVSMSDATQGATAADYMFKTLGLKKIAVLHDGSTYGQGIAEVVRDQFTKDGGTVTAFEGITVGEKDFRAVLTKIAADKPEGIYFGGFQAEASVLASQRSEVGLGDTVFFTDEGCFSDAFIKAAGDAANGVYATMAETKDSDALKAFRDRYKAKYGDNPTDIGPYHAHAYDAMSLVIAAIDKVAVDDGNGNLTIDRAKLVDAIRQTKGYQGLTGEITFNERGERMGLAVIVYQVKDGKWEPVSQ